MKLRIRAAVRTDAGRVRANNEDNFYLNGRIRQNVRRDRAHARCAVRTGPFLAAVADGMGGEARGELASLLAVQSLRPCPFAQAVPTALACVAEANARICEQIVQIGGRMGSTLAALFAEDGRVICCNIGDSRCYLLRDGVLTRLSTDHNKAGRMVELGVLTPEQASRHPSRHELTQHLGIFPEELVIEPAFSDVLELQAGDLFLLCSDGLTDMASEAEIAACLRGGGSPGTLAKALVRLALARGGRDNVTALVARVEERRFLPRRRSTPQK